VIGLPLIVVLAVLGLMIGSFLNVCIARLPVGESVVSPPSRCPSCGVPIRWFDNVPVLGFVLLRARCRHCHSRISLRYPLVEIVTSVAFVLQGLVVGDSPLMLADRLVFTSCLIVLFGIDLDTQRLPNVITLPGLVVGVLFSLGVPPGLVPSLIGAGLGAGLLFAIRWAWKRATGVDGMGLGDVKMLAMIGAFLGWRQVWVVLFCASLTGAVVGLLLAATKARTLQTRLPFGTFLAVAAFAASLVGEPVLQWYLSLY
jgi:leader peptidase (prepilin peptidase)/N-methyltransferase